jgi:nitroimidazol reductase NimA-like FMN-containing flavoprotein (pyridoxamine 5'-phosphate oxidase superfamily)
MPEAKTATIEVLDEDECVRLISPGGVGRIAFTGRYGPTVLPVNYKLYEGDIVFRTRHDSTAIEDLRTGIDDAAYKVAFEMDELDSSVREGWSVLVQGGARHMDSEEDRAIAQKAGVESWAPGERDLFVRIAPTRITGRRLSHR